MQTNATSVHRGALLLSGVAAIALCVLCYSHFSSRTETQYSTKLHRSNATHGRRRRRVQRSPRPAHDDTDYLQKALERITHAEESGQGFGIFEHPLYMNPEVRENHGDSFQLLPSNLSYIHNTIRDVMQVPPEREDQLKFDIACVFMDNFIKLSFPQGYNVGHDLNTLQQELAHAIDPRHMRLYMDQKYPTENSQAANTHADTQEDSTHLPSAEYVAQALSAEDNSGSTRPYEQWADGEDNTEGHQVLDLLYRIGEEQAKRNGYQHRGVQCNNCSVTPIAGIRYHCANCWDFDLCENCEAQQNHFKTHVFYKIRIPAPTRGQIKLVQPTWYPGDPNACPESIPEMVRDQLLKSTQLDRQELDAFYDQFKCMAGKALRNDTSGIGMAIDRAGFGRYFTTTAADRAPTPNLIYDRIFCFYDSNGDDLISFVEYATGMAELAYNKSREARIQRLFKAYDLNDDGYVDRRDFLLLLRAHYSLSKESAHELIYSRDDAILTDEEIHEVIHGNNPISAAFGGSSFIGHQSRHGIGKHLDEHGDLVFDEGVTEVLKDDSTMMGNRAQAIARQAAEGRPFLRARESSGNEILRDAPIMGGYYDHSNSITLSRYQTNESDEDRNPGHEDIDHLGHLQDDRWPNEHTEAGDVVEALGTDIPLEDIMDPIDRRRVLYAQRERFWHELETNNLETERVAVEERWQRRRFYLDEEEGLRPPAAYQESDTSEDEHEPEVYGTAKQPLAVSGARRPSLRSRSSSKVRFDESAMQSEMETKSDVSSRNTPLNERWGGFEFSQPNREVGAEIIYEAVQEAFNDMLDHFFKEQEDKYLAAKASYPERTKYRAQLQAYEKDLAIAAERKRQALIDADMERTNALLGVATNMETLDSADKSDAIRDETGFASIESNPRQIPGSASQVDQMMTTSDPTLPQNRPDEATTESQQSGKYPSRSQLKVWHEHDLIDAEAKVRGGYGKLDLQDFKRKLRDNVADDIDVGPEDKDDGTFWEARADLGKWSFLSAWIEVGSF